jgi:hypothetical protein
MNWLHHGRMRIIYRSGLKCTHTVRYSEIEAKRFKTRPPSLEHPTLYFMEENHLRSRACFIHLLPEGHAG